MNHFPEVADFCGGTMRSFIRRRKAALVGLLGGAFGMIVLMALAGVIYSGDGYGSMPSTPPLVYPNF